jgi:hypothetical protein
MPTNYPNNKAEYLLALASLSFGLYSTTILRRMAAGGDAE